MPNQQRYWATDVDWATSVEIVSNDPGPNDRANLPIATDSGNPVKFVVFAATTPEGSILSHEGGRIAILDSDSRAVPLSASPSETESFLFPDHRIAILNNPEGRRWYASIEPRSAPISVTGMAFHPSPSNTPPLPRVRCRICKITAKALALAILAGAALAATPAAVIAAVAAWLGAATIMAIAFINSVVGDTAAAIAEKLCIAAGLCP